MIEGDHRYNYVILWPLIFFAVYTIISILTISSSLAIFYKSKICYISGGLMLFGAVILIGCSFMLELMGVILYWTSPFYGTFEKPIPEMYNGLVVSLTFLFGQFWFEIFVAMMIKVSGTGWY